jgi:hypothetical protein
MMGSLMNVEQLAEWEFAEEIETPDANPPQFSSDGQKSHMT